MIRKLTMVCLIMFLVAACARSPGGENISSNDDGSGSGLPGTVTSDSGTDADEGSDTTEDDADSEDDLTDEPIPDGTADEDGGTDDPEAPGMEAPAPVEITYYMNSIYDIKPLYDDVEENVVLLTFDDGPKELDMISNLLDVLDQHDAKAIFFVNGYRVKANPDLLKLIYDRGHAIGNHSWDHINLMLESDDKIRQQVDDVQAIVEQTIGIRPQFFRPPHGSSNEFLRDYVKEQGMLFMTWSNGSLDWDAKHRTPEAVIANVLDQLRPGSNILMHELPWTVEAMDELLTKLTESGYHFVDPHAIQIIDQSADAATHE